MFKLAAVGAALALAVWATTVPVVPVYTTRVIATPDSVGLEVTWRRDSTEALTWGNVRVCLTAPVPQAPRSVPANSNPPIGQGCDHLPAFHDNTFANSGVATAWISLAGRAGHTLDISACVETQYGTLAKNTYPCPKLAASYIVPLTAPPLPPPSYVRQVYNTTNIGTPIILRIMMKNQDCPIRIIYDEDPATPLYTTYSSDPACAPYVDVTDVQQRGDSLFVSWSATLPVVAYDSARVGNCTSLATNCGPWVKVVNPGTRLTGVFGYAVTGAQSGTRFDGTLTGYTYISGQMTPATRNWTYIVP